jgi:hypothetical protein
VLLLAEKNIAPPYTFIPSGEIVSSGTVVGGGTTVPEFQNNSVFKEILYQIEALFTLYSFSKSVFSKNNTNSLDLALNETRKDERKHTLPLPLELVSIFFYYAPFAIPVEV